MNKKKVENNDLPAEINSKGAGRKKKPLTKIAALCMAVLLIGSAGLVAAAASNNASSASGAAPSASSSGTMDGGQRGPWGMMGGADAYAVAAQVLGTTTDAIKQAEQNGTSLGQQLIDAGKLDAFKTAYLDAVKASLDSVYSKAQAAIDGWDGTAALPGMGGPGMDSTGAGQRGGMGDKPGGMMGGADACTVAAQVLGTTTDAIKQAQQSGTSIGQQLIDAGKLDAFKTAYLDAVKASLDSAVTSGKMTQDQADSMYAQMQTTIGAWDGTTNLPGCSPRGMGPGMKGGMGDKGSMSGGQSSKSSGQLDATTGTNA